VTNQEISTTVSDKHNATTLHTIEANEATRYLRAWILLTGKTDTQYNLFVKIINRWVADNKRQTLFPKEGAYALHSFLLSCINHLLVPPMFTKQWHDLER